MADGAGAASVATAGAAGISTTAATDVGAATGAGSDLLAQADKDVAAIKAIKYMNIFNIFFTIYPRNCR